MLRTIIIDDEQDSREALRLALEKYCPEVDLVAVCDNPQGGIESIKTNKPDLVFLDVQMPHMSGIELLARLRALDETLPVILITGYAHLCSPSQALALGATDYIMKPFEPEILIASLERASKSLHRIQNASV